MISPRAFRLLVRYLDAVDREVSRKLVRIRPWLETALSSLLADLLDETTSDESPLVYPYAALLRDLASESNLFGVSIRIETREYPPEIENRITQSDLGLVLAYRDNLRPVNSWEAPFLLQAKRLAPSLHSAPQYRPGSRFSAIDQEQLQRIEVLNKHLGAEFVKYLLYCPRPAMLDDETRTALDYARVQALESDIFDYLTGLEVRDDLLREEPTLAAGIFVSDPSDSPATLMQCHSRILRASRPFSWFVAMTFASRHNFHRTGRQHPDFPGHGPGTAPTADTSWALGVLRGETRSIRRLITALGDSNDDSPRLSGAFLPPHVMTITLTVAPNLQHNERNSAEL